MVLLALSSTTPSIPEKIVHYADKWSVPVEVMTNVIVCESNGSTTVQSQFYKNGKQEQSYGIAQLNIEANPSITLGEALDPDYSLNYLGEKLANGQGKLWSCFRKEYN